MISGSPVRRLWCLLLLLLIVPGSGAARPGAREVMADAMAKMMEAMGLFDSAPAQRDLGGIFADPWSLQGPFGALGWGPTFGAPWGGPVPDRSRAAVMRELMRRFTRQMPLPGGNSGDWPTAWKPSRLEGVWEGRDGELVIVQGERFRIYSPELQRVDGLMRIRGNRLALYNPLDGHARPFEFTEHQGRLIMRDPAGQLYLYRRLWLDGGRGAVWTDPE
ncbi:hypothetical protein [Candidatus Thiosymbion oneisti]|uniref:hypothetical protein n=1 Tax=Candidatus Thiosymbion oneisti TaxID=589554 RepID=UPI00105B74F2|nr:hypothetical protein [Candidatus Thiosymbion oneisti]